MPIVLLTDTIQTLLSGLMGAVLGGAVTLAGLLISLRHQERTRRDDRLTEYLTAAHVTANRMYARVLSFKPDPASITAAVEELVARLTALDAYAQDLDPETLETGQLLLEDILGSLRAWQKSLHASHKAVLLLFEGAGRHASAFYGHLLSGQRHIVAADLLNGPDEPADD